jgi:hypothetical protein
VKVVRKLWFCGPLLALVGQNPVASGTKKWLACLKLAGSRKWSMLSMRTMADMMNYFHGLLVLVQRETLTISLPQSILHTNQSNSFMLSWNFGHLDFPTIILLQKNVEVSF